MQRLDGSLPTESLAQTLVEFSKMPGITTEDVLGEIFVMFLAGHETTAHTLSWYVYALCNQPKLQEENCAAICAAATTQRSAFALPPIVEATLKESMRKYPVAVHGSMRRVDNAEGYTLKAAGAEGQDVHLPRGTWIQVPIFALHNCTHNWGQNANVFDPYRWFETSAHNEEDSKEDSSARVGWPKTSKGSYIGWGPHSGDLSFAPFSFGPRNCLGMNLALFELRKTIPRLLREFSFELADTSITDEKFALQTFLTLHPSTKLAIRLTSRGRKKVEKLLNGYENKSDSEESEEKKPLFSNYDRPIE